MSRQPCQDRVVIWHWPAQAVLECAPGCLEHPFHRLNAMFRRPVKLWLILRRHSHIGRMALTILHPSCRHLHDPRGVTVDNSCVAHAVDVFGHKPHELWGGLRLST